MSWTRPNPEPKLLVVSFSRYPWSWCHRPKYVQWRNSRGEGTGGHSAPQHFHREISADLPGKERQGKRGQWRRKEGKSKKGRWKIENGRGKSYKMRRGPLCFFFCFVLFLFVFCLFFFFFFAFHFSKPLKFVLGLPKWEFSIGEKHFTPGKKNQEKWLCPLWKIFLLRLCLCTSVKRHSWFFKSWWCLICYIMDMFGWMNVKVDAKSDTILFDIAGSLFLIASTGFQSTKEINILWYFLALTEHAKKNRNTYKHFSTSLTPRHHCLLYSKKASQIHTFFFFFFFVIDFRESSAPFHTSIDRLVDASSANLTKHWRRLMAQTG